MMKRILFGMVLVAFGSISFSAAQDIEPQPLPRPTTSGPLITSTSTERIEYSPTTDKDVEETSTSSETTETAQTESVPTEESTPSGTTATTDNDYTETTSEEVTETSTDSNESTTEVNTSTTEYTDDTSTEAEDKASTKDNYETTAPNPEEPTSTPQTTTENNTTVAPTTVSTPRVPTITTTSPPTRRPLDKNGNGGNSPLFCRLVLQDGNAYYNWIFRVIIVPKECFFCCRIGFFGLEQCTQINPFFCSC